MHALAHQHFDRFQIDAPSFTLVGKELLHQAVYFAGDFLLDRIGRFFSCGDWVSGSEGRI
jgi:hypothetical protein